MKTHNGTLADLAIQCTHPDTGATGSWLFVAGNHKTPNTAVTPLFSDLVDLFNWCRANGWTPIGHGLNQRYIYHDYPACNVK